MKIALNPHKILTQEEKYVLALNHILGVEVTFVHNREYKSNISAVDKHCEWGPIVFLADGTRTFLNSLLLHDGNDYVSFNEYTMNTWNTSITYLETKNKQFADRFKVKISNFDNLSLTGVSSYGF